MDVITNRALGVWGLSYSADRLKINNSIFTKKNWDQKIAIKVPPSGPSLATPIRNRYFQRDTIHPSGVLESHFC